MSIYNNDQTLQILRLAMDPQQISQGRPQIFSYVVLFYPSNEATFFLLLVLVVKKFDEAQLSGGFGLICEISFFSLLTL